MRNEKNCELCIWYDQCGYDSVCDDFTSAESDVDEQTDTYTNSIMEMQHFYEHLIEEQD